MIGVDGDEPFAGKNGHDWREWFQIRRVIRTFKPDVVHFHTPVFFMALYVRIVRLFGLFDCSIVCSWHLPAHRRMGWAYRVFFWLLGKDCYYLPVSTPTWEGLKRWLPYAKGEVFFNPVKIGRGGRIGGLTDCRIDGLGEGGLTDCRIVGLTDCLGGREQSVNRSIGQSVNFIVGMVGRNAAQKDWPAFHKVEEKVKEKVSGFQGLKVSGEQGFKVGDEDRQYALAQKKVAGWLTGVTRETFVAALEELVEEKVSTGEYRFKRDMEKGLAFEGAKRFFDEFSRKIIPLSDGRCVYFAPDARSRNRNGNDLSRCWAEYAFHAVSSSGKMIFGKDYPERWFNKDKMASIDRIVPILQSEVCKAILLDKQRFKDAVAFLGETADGRKRIQVVTRVDYEGAGIHNLAEVTVLLMNARKNTPPLKLLSEVVESVERHQGAGYLPSTFADNIPNPAIVDNPPWPSQSNNQTILNQTISSVEFLNAGEKKACDGREAIRKMDLFMMTSKHEELPTVVLECFLEGTPICGFLPGGGTSDILQYSKGPVREAFITERNCEMLADVVMDLLAHPEKRQAMVEDGRQILEEHFDAEKNVRGQLMRIYIERSKD